jgi:CBS domain-containing protein
MKAKDIMVPIQDYLSPDATVKKAVNLLRTAVQKEQKNRVMGLPVIDDDRKLVGMLSMTDILKAAYPAYMKMADLSEFTWDGMLESLARQEGNKKVKEIMTSPVITVQENNPLMECVDLLLKKHIRQMPVLNKAGNVVGMLSTRDIFCAVTQSMIENK